MSQGVSPHSSAYSAGGGSDVTGAPRRPGTAPSAMADVAPRPVDAVAAVPVVIARHDVDSWRTGRVLWCGSGGVALRVALSVPRPAASGWSGRFRASHPLIDPAESRLTAAERTLTVAAGRRGRPQKGWFAMGAERGMAGRWDFGGLGWAWRVAGLVAAVLLAGVVGVGRARAALPSDCAQSGETVACTFSFTGFPDQTFEVPAGVSSVNVVAVGAPGGPAGPRFPSPTPGGAGAAASGVLSVTGGQTLYIEVGGAGDAGFTDSEGGLTGRHGRLRLEPREWRRWGSVRCAHRSVFAIRRVDHGSAPPDCGWRWRRRRGRSSPGRPRRCRGRSRAAGSRRHSTRLPRRGRRRFAGHDQFLRQRRRGRRGR